MTQQQSTGQTHVVFGAGQIGTPLAQLLVARGHTVRQVRRKSAAVPAGVTVVHGDAADLAFAARAAEGATAIYHCMNPAYSTQQWEDFLPRWADSLTQAAGRAKARLVVLDNLYNLGVPAGPINEDTPMAATTRKGAIRERVQAKYIHAHERGHARVVMGRASDFFGPGASQSHFGDSFWPGVLANGGGTFIVPVDVPHSLAYTHDVVAGLATLAEAPEEAYCRWWVLPTGPAITARETAKHLSAALGRNIRINVIPSFIRRTLGLFMPTLRELEEMMPTWRSPYVVDDRQFRERFGVSHTPMEEAATATVAWAREHYGRK
ncbi:MAG: NAD-dependent epimerase/dehydratase family protein [Candidatus Eisenbacteria bacterium]